MNVPGGQTGSNSFVPTWSDVSRKRAIKIYQGQSFLAIATVFFYVHCYEVISLFLRQESMKILAMLTEGLLWFSAYLILYLVVSPLIVDISARKYGVSDYVNGFERLNWLVGTPLAATVSVSVGAFLMYGGVIGTLFFLFGTRSLEFSDYLVLLASIPISVALAFPIGFFVVRDANHQLEVLKAQL